MFNNIIMIIFQVLEAIAPPYTVEFIHLFLPMVEDEEITGTMRGDSDNDLVSEFIGEFMKYLTQKLYSIIICIICIFFLVHCKAHCPTIR